MIYTVRYSHIKKICAFVEAHFGEAPGQLPSLPSPKSGADLCQSVFFTNLYLSGLMILSIEVMSGTKCLVPLLRCFLSSGVVSVYTQNWLYEMDGDNATISRKRLFI